MLWRTRARAVGVIALVWAAASSLVGGGIVLRAFILHPSVIRVESILDGLKYVGAWTALGSMCGAAFSLLLLAFARGRPIGRLAATPVTASVAVLAFLVGALTDGSKAATGLAAVAAALAAATFWLSTRPSGVAQAHTERAT